MLRRCAYEYSLPFSCVIVLLFSDNKYYLRLKITISSSRVLHVVLFLVFVIIIIYVLAAFCVCACVCACLFHRISFFAAISHYLFRMRGRVANLNERFTVQRGATDKKSIDIRLRCQFIAVASVHASWILTLEATSAETFSFIHFRTPACTSCAWSGVATLPVPIAQTGS